MTMRKIVFILLIASFSSLLSAQSGNKQVPIKKDTKENVVQLTDLTFKQKVFDYVKNKEWKFEGTMPCIVDFYADWCGPCRRVSPILDEIAKEYSGKLIVYKVNTDKEQILSSSLGIQSLPTILFIPMTGKPQAIMGAYPKEELLKIVNQILK
jgi:thioredoxin 1